MNDHVLHSCKAHNEEKPKQVVCPKWGWHKHRFSTEVGTGNHKEWVQCGSQFFIGFYHSACYDASLSIVRWAAFCKVAGMIPFMKLLLRSRYSRKGRLPLWWNLRWKWIQRWQNSVVKLTCIHHTNTNRNLRASLLHRWLWTSHLPIVCSLTQL